MTKGARLQKRSHKLLLVFLKLIPMVTALCYLLNTVLACFGIEAAILSHLSGMSLLPWLFILLAAFVFKFCIYHRMFLYYIFVSDAINIYDYYIGIPIDTYGIIILNLCISGLFLFLVLYFYVKCHKKPTQETA